MCFCREYGHVNTDFRDNTRRDTLTNSWKGRQSLDFFYIGAQDLSVVDLGHGGDHYRQKAHREIDDTSGAIAAGFPQEYLIPETSPGSI
jgi:hypothetical protein